MARVLSAFQEILLVVFLGTVECSGGDDFGDNGFTLLARGLLEFCFCLFRQFFLFGSMEKNHRAVLGADILPLLIRRGGVVIVPE